MGKVGMTAVLKSQLEVANATIGQLMSQMERMSKTIDNQSATIKSLELTIKNLEEQLLKKEDVLASAEAQKKALGKLLEKKNEKVKTSFVPKTQEEKDAEDAMRVAERKARGNNGAKRNMHYEMEVEEKDVTPEDDIVLNKAAVEIGVKDFIRYSMVPPRFIKTIYHNHAFRLDEKVYTGCRPQGTFPEFRI